MDTEVQAAYERGRHDGEVRALGESLTKAHERIDKLEPRVTALERVMYAGMGIVFLIQIFPTLTQVISK